MCGLVMMQDVLTSFCQIYPRNRNRLDELVGVYMKVLGRYSDHEVQEAAWRCMDELTFFPKPADISQRIKRVEVEDGSCAISRHPVRCSRCIDVAICIQEPIGAAWECRECYTGLEPHEIKKRYSEIYNQIGKIGSV